MISLSYPHPALSLRCEFENELEMVKRLIRRIRTTQSTPGAFDTKGETTKAIDDHFLAIKDILFREDNPTYILRLCQAPNALVIVEAAVGFSKTHGSEVCHCKRRGHCAHGLTYLTENNDPKRSLLSEDGSDGVP